MAPRTQVLPRHDLLPWLLPVLSLLALIDAVFNDFYPDNGIHGSEGAWLVVASTLLLLLASAATARRVRRGGLRNVLEFLIVLDIVCTGFAAYMLQAWILLVLMVLALIAWLVHVTGGRSRLRTAEVA